MTFLGGVGLSRREKVSYRKKKYDESATKYYNSLGQLTFYNRAASEARSLSELDGLGMRVTEFGWVLTGAAAVATVFSS